MDLAKKKQDFGTHDESLEMQKVEKKRKSHHHRRRDSSQNPDKKPSKHHKKDKGERSKERKDKRR